MVIMLDHCWNEKVDAQPFFIIIILDVPAQIFLFGWGFIWIGDSATEMRALDDHQNILAHTRK